MSRGIFSAAAQLTAAELNDCFDPPRTRLSKSATQSVANSTTVAVTFDTEDFDDGGMHSTTTNTSRITVPVGGAGTYLVGGMVEFAANATGQRTIYIVLNGTATQVTVTNVTASGTVASRLAATTLVQLVAGDYLELQVNQNSGGALNVNDTNTHFWATWVAV